MNTTKIVDLYLKGKITFGHALKETQRNFDKEEREALKRIKKYL